MFKCVKMLSGSENLPAVVYLSPTASETYEAGEALEVSLGCVTKASTKVDYILAGSELIDGLLPCYYVTDMCVLEAETTEDLDDVTVGSRLSLATDAMGLGDISSSGLATVFAVNENTVEVIFK